jgi:hypothetical protein
LAHRLARGRRGWWIEIHGIQEAEGPQAQISPDLPRSHPMVLVR